MLLHDHLDGGLRPGTIADLARESGYDRLPATDPDNLRTWFAEASDSGSLERYLETFDHTVGVHPDRGGADPRRVRVRRGPRPRRCGVRRGPVRPRAAHPRRTRPRGLSLEKVVEAVLKGFADGGRDHGIRVGTLLTAMRHQARSMEIAELAVRYRDAGVVGFDIAGAEAGYPPTRHLDAFEYLQRENAHFTIHAGEAFGLPSIWQAIQWCGADRLGHGVRIIDDITDREGELPQLGRLAAYVRDKRIPLEMCPSSNVQTGAAKSIAAHPIGLLRRLYFRVTVNTDNRLMSGTTLSEEFAKLVEAFDYDWDDLQWFTVNAMKSAFLGFDERLELINGVIKPGFAQLKWRSHP